MNTTNHKGYSWYNYASNDSCHFWQRSAYS